MGTTRRPSRRVARSRRHAASYRTALPRYNDGAFDRGCPFNASLFARCRFRLCTAAPNTSCARCINSFARTDIRPSSSAFRSSGRRKKEILAHAAAWRLIDLSESNGSVDRSRHRNEISDPTSSAIRTRWSWLLHQYRAAYELCGTQYSDFTHDDEDVGLRQSLIDLDTKMLGECRRLFAIAQNTSNRLEKYNGLTAKPLYPPPPFADRLEPGPYGDYVLFVGRPGIDQAARSCRPRHVARRSAHTG